ncbi:MAG: ABC transporter substrate-binding protein [Tenericutes bacterium]|nr:ABC transporter substrate-binding protein [Mycoplasmatota bacterium]
MKKIILLIITILVCTALVWLGFFQNQKSDLKKVRVAEVTHSIFYAPQYLAHSLGYFEEEGLDVEFILTSGADKVTTAVLSGDVEIGFCGSEATIYVYNNGEKDYLVNFAGLTKKDGSFLVSRKKESFDIKNLVGKHIIAGRKAGMPAMTLEYALNQNGVKTSEVNFDTSIDFASTTGAFIGGTGDYVSVFEPTASSLEKQGVGHIVASIGELGGTVPYTAYNARLSYIKNNEDVIKGFTKAIDKALVYVKEHNSSEIAEAISSYFPDTSLNDITAIVDRYKNIDAWFDNTNISEKDFNHVMDIMENAGELTNRAPYSKLVTNIK